MSDNKVQLLKMIQRYLSGEATAEEKKFLMSYYDLFEHKENVLDQLQSEEKKLLGEQMKANIMAGIETGSKVKRMWLPVRKICAAAAILIFCIAGAYLLFHTKTPQLSLQHDILPGSNKAILTLANGHKIDLNDAKSGELAKQSGITIAKSVNGELVYTVSGTSNQKLASSINTIETPAGGQYKVILPDGTNVWLNAASSLTYPTAFTGAERKVSLKGEGYFEVAKNAKKPFKISINNQTEVKVLGTHFNINAYSEEKTINTTLLEGSVMLTSNKHTAKLIPGQQARVDKSTDGIALVNNIDMNQAVAWKNGFFCYDTISLDMLMKQIEKWYDVKVIYKGDVDAEFVAQLPRNLPLSKLLNLLELTKKVHFKLNGKTLEVMK